MGAALAVSGAPPPRRERPALRAAARRPSLLGPAGGAATLEDLIAGAWDGLLSGSSAACPVCAGELLPRHSAGAGVVGGRCAGCPTTLE